MNLTVNFRNNTTRFIKINGIDTVIKPNDEIEDITYQWFTSENKTIDLFSTILPFKISSLKKSSQRF